MSYLNTAPLVWGMLHGPQQDVVDLSFHTPAACAEAIERNQIDAGLAPVAEIARQGLLSVPGYGIACVGAVRSILLFSRVPWKQIRTMAADSSSRTSVQLARVILRENYGVDPTVEAHAPSLHEMLSGADAALIIGDPALRIEPEETGFRWLDLGEQWHKLTGLPMVFATWAGKPNLALAGLRDAVRDSYEFGKARLAEIASKQAAAHGVSEELASYYLRDCIRYEIGKEEQKGLDAFLELAGLNQGVER